MPLLPCSYVINKEKAAINPNRKGTKVAAYYNLNVPAGQERQVYLRLTDDSSQPTGDPFGVKFQDVFQSRIEEADDFYSKIMPSGLGPQQKLVSRQAYAGKQEMNSVSRLQHTSIPHSLCKHAYQFISYTLCYYSQATLQFNHINFLIEVNLHTYNKNAQTHIYTYRLAVDKAVLLLLREGMGGGRSSIPSTSRVEEVGEKCPGVGAHLQPRHHLHA